MAKINRFYLLIAAFICSNAYAVDCSDSKVDIGRAKECHTFLLNNRQLFPPDFRNCGIYNPENWCDNGWSGSDADGNLVDDYSTCSNVIQDGLEETLCQDDSICIKVLKGEIDCTEEDDDTGGDSGGDPEYPLGACDDTDTQGILSEIEGALDNVDNFVNSRPTQADFDGMGIKACEEWSDPDEYGVEHCTIVTGSVVAEYECGHITQAYYDYCMRMYHGEILCYGNMPCEDGQYKSETECLLCEAMRWIDKNNNEHDIKNVKPTTTTGADSQADCYIPANTTGLEDATGYFSYTGNCPYYGS